MGKDWDKKKDFTEIWKECFRVLKPGAFGFIMNAPRGDCQLLLYTELAAAGFNLEFSQMYWAYATGWTKAGNIYKKMDEAFLNNWIKHRYSTSLNKVKKYFTSENKTKQKRLRKKYDHWFVLVQKKWAKEEYNKEVIIKEYEHPGRKNRSYQTSCNIFSGDRKNDKLIEEDNDDTHYYKKQTVTEPISPEAIKYAGSFAGLQPKPAVETIIVVMKPLDEKTFYEQALKNGKGITWFDPVRIPYLELNEYINNTKKGFAGNGGTGVYGWNSGDQTSCKDSAKPPLSRADFLKTPEGKKFKKKLIGGRAEQEKRWTFGDEKVDGYESQNFDDVEVELKGRMPANLIVSDNILSKRFSRYFSLDAWWNEKIGKNIINLPNAQQNTFPFLTVPKASKKEKNKGLEKFETKTVQNLRANAGPALVGEDKDKRTQTKNVHPTVKPEVLMSYLILLGSQEGDIILDPFAGSGTTWIACYKNNRDCIAIEQDEEYYNILKARVKEERKQKKLL